MVALMHEQNQIKTLKKLGRQRESRLGCWVEEKLGFRSGLRNPRHSFKTQ